MKKRMLFFLALPFAIACNNSAKDSVQKADSINEAKTDTSKTNTNQPTLGVDQSTADFMVKVADVGMTEVKLGELAKQKSTNKSVKEFAQMMVADHSKARDELKSLAAQKNVTLPSVISKDHQDKYDDLNKKSGKDFDKSYMDAMVDGHQSTVDDFEKTSKDTKDADVKEWVDKTLPVLRKHLDRAKEIQKQLK